MDPSNDPLPLPSEQGDSVMSEDSSGDPRATLNAAWVPLLNSPPCSPVSLDDLQAASEATTEVAKLLVADEQLRAELGASSDSNPGIWPDLCGAFLRSRNQLFCVFGAGPRGVACNDRANRCVDLAVAFFMLVRNMCAGVCHNQRRAWEENLHQTAEMILSYLCSWLTTTKKEACIVLREKATKAVNMGTQMLANMMTCNPELQDKMWPLFFKDSDLLKQLLITSEGPSSRYVLTCIRNCTYKDTQHCAYLTSTASGREVLKLLLCAACRYVSDEASNTFDIVYSIFSNMIELELTPRIMEALCCGKDPSRKHIFSCEHITFLKLLDGMVDARSNSDRPLVGIGIDTNVFMVKLFGKLVRNAERIAAQEKTVDASAFGMDVDGMILLLQYMGRVTQDLGPDAKVKLVQEGLGEALMILLKLANRIQPRTKPGGKQEPPKEGNRGLFMVKSDIVKVVGNLAYEAKEVQDEFRRIGAMPMILDQCNIDDNNPFIKENAIFALRNLCDGNFENQSIIAAMEARGVAENPVLDEAGVEAVIDETGKLRLKPRLETDDPIRAPRFQEVEL